jgi:hypothetical protein
MKKLILALLILTSTSAQAGICSQVWSAVATYFQSVLGLTNADDHLSFIGNFDDLRGRAHDKGGRELLEIISKSYPDLTNLSQLGALAVILDRGIKFIRISNFRDPSSDSESTFIEIEQFNKRVSSIAIWGESTGGSVSKRVSVAYPLEIETTSQLSRVVNFEGSWYKSSYTSSVPQEITNDPAALFSRVLGPFGARVRLEGYRELEFEPN